MSEEVKISEENQFSFENPEYRKTYWHTCSHVLAQAVKRLWPEVKLAIGPSIDNGFYYDMLAPFSFTPENLAEIEAEMRKICKEKLKLERFELPRAEAIKFMEEKEEPFKVELINDLPEDAVISFYKQGEFTDLCAGPHLDSTGRIKGNGIKLTACNAAYWRGDSNREVLQRIYGVAFPKKEELDAYLKEREEAVKRDHNKLGRELEYFTTVDCIGQGLPVLLPKGARVVQVLQRWVEDTEQKRGYLLTKTPLMAKRDLYKISGHWDHYLNGMFILGDPYDETKECFALRPMTCPFQYQVYLNRQRSYRDLPMRLGETSTLFRNEDSGEMHGLIRVRQFTISEGHLVLRPDQLEEEFKGCLDLAKYCLGTVGLLDKCTFRFSQWDPANPNNKYEGTKEQWDHAQSVMERILKDLDVDYTVGIDEAAFYGPKLDIQYKNVYGKEDTLVTIQIDMLLRHVLHRRKRREEAAVHHPPHVSRLLRAHARLPHRGVCRRAADVDGARAGALPARYRSRRRLLRRAGQEARRHGLPRRGRLPQREDRPQDPRRADGEGSLHARRRRPRHGERHRFPAPPRGRRPRRDEHGRVLRASQAGRGQQGKEVNNTRILHNQYVRPSCDQGGALPP